MELGLSELRIFVSLLVILAAALVALICDFLKGNNERLRELAVELSVRREAEETRAPGIEKAAELPRMQAEPAANPAMTRSTPTSGPTTAATRPEDVGHEKTRPVEALAPRRKESPAPVARDVAKPVAPAVKFPPNMRATVVSRPVEPRGPKKDWQSLLAQSSAKAVPAEAAVLRGEGIAEVGAASRRIPPGQRVSGLVVSVGVTGLSKSAAAMPDAVAKMIESMIGPGEFCCPVGEDEFLLVCPRERGADAQRRLRQIAQQLWDFQLRSLGTLAVLFSWGGLEVKDETFEEAMSSARERMQETRDGRRSLSPKLLEMEPRRLRAAV